ncbi:uncharacterized protein LOC142978970 [Anticarsia gemmatalis]|uniref:uncharacterized protein LOC142978970 n=1 Tax=Anticarsia gemmatalis TaxID=129554 RepID=UPI003F75D333
MNVFQKVPAMRPHLIVPALTFTFAIYIDIAHASHCDNITAIYSPKPQYVSVFGESRPLSLYWGSGPARAASALLLVVLRYVLGYQNVRLRQGPLQLTELSREVGHSEFGDYNETILALSAAWRPDHSPIWQVDRGMVVGLAGPRLGEFGASSIPVRQILHVFIANDFQSIPMCNDSKHWYFFNDMNALNLCGFLHDKSNETLKKATVYEVGTSSTTKILLRARTSHLHLRYEELDRANLFRMLRTSNVSFLFMDYDMWSGASHVSAVQLPPCTPATPFGNCQQELDTAIAMRVADLYHIEEFAPLIMQLVHNFNLSNDIVREILEQESTNNNVTEAACQWATEHREVIEGWKRKHGEIVYQILLFYKDPINEGLEYLFGYIIFKHNRSFKIRIKIRGFLTDQLKDTYVKKTISKYMERGIKQRYIGAVVGGVKDATFVAKSLEGSSLPVVLYEAADIHDESTSVWSVTGTSLQQALALNHFIRSMRWTRVAVLSEETDTAASLLKYLTDTKNYGLRDHRVTPKMTRPTAINILKQVQNENAYIIFVNTDYEDAVTILLAAEELKMNGENYAWVVRDWRPNNITKNIKHITISFSYRNIMDVSSNNGWEDFRQSLHKVCFNTNDAHGVSNDPCRRFKKNKSHEKLMPTHSSAIIDAILTLVNGFQDVITEHPSTRYDTHSKEALAYFNESLTQKTIKGITQNLTIKGHSLEETVVFIEEWHGDSRELLARWRVNSTARSVRIEEVRRAAWNDPPKDGASGCIMSSGDLYSPTCYDPAWAVGLLIVVMTSVTMMLAYRAMQRRIIKEAEEHVRQWQTRRDESAAALTAYLVDRSALEQRHELGAGRFGCVRLAVLRMPGCVPRAVAAKALRNSQEEAEILREACTLASLDHDNIIRLVGVCIDDKPPLILMEVAFFGDLSKYLQDRRYLVEGSTSDSETDLSKGNEEASHVSAHALTQLARQAASALGYLSLRGVIHRDLRASNCLVDANRCLKLADFGMARATAAVGMDGGTEYACRRRGLFPVLWMAPESLEQGVFSAASDVWALGVLVFELVTLGARPFGDMSPLRVMHYVAEGNKPPMPRDATPQTNALAHLCWRRKPEERPTAAEVVVYLAERPYALRPALMCEHEQLASPDSGFSDSPMSALLP